MMTDEDTRTPAKVLRAAAEVGGDWAVWHPGDGTQYRVKLIPVLGGPNHGDAVLLVSVTGTCVSVMFNRRGAGSNHRFIPWSHERWKAQKMNPVGGYDWWATVIKPLLAVAGALR